MNLKNLMSKNITQEEYLNYNNATIVYKKLPAEIKGLIIRKNDINIIIINKLLSDKQKKKAILHELVHLELNHTYKSIHINRNDIENEVERYLNDIIINYG